MANALSYYKDPSTTETEHFCRQFDRFFDCLNVRSKSEWYTKKKDDLKPYTSLDDVRLNVCLPHYLLVGFNSHLFMYM